MTSTPLFSNMLDPELDRAFSRLCADVDSGLLHGLLQDVDEHVVQAHEALALNEFLDVSTAEKIATVLKGLLKDIEKYPQPKQRLVIGAARYFVRSQDAQNDMKSLLGFDDDATVLNYVLAELGHHEKRITL